MISIRRQIAVTPIVAPLARLMYHALTSKHRSFAGSVAYWEQRYREGGCSGAGSYGKFGRFKAQVLNQFVVEHGIRTVMEFGCGDGNQLSLARYPQYLGFDVSTTAVAMCRSRFRDDPSKSFALVSEHAGQTAELVLSLDVIFHLVEDAVFQEYMTRLFRSSTRYVIIYSSNRETNDASVAPHIRHRSITSWINDKTSGWRIVSHVPNPYPYRGNSETGSFSDFFICETSCAGAVTPQHCNVATANAA